MKIKGTAAFLSKNFLVLAAALFLISSASAAANFHISSFEISPSSVTVDASSPKPVEATVKVSNWGDSANAVVKIEVLDPTGTPKVLDLAGATKLTTPPKSIGDSAEVFGVADGLSFNVDSTWEPGLYAVYARVFDTAGDLHDTSVVKYLSVGLAKPALVPDFSILLLPLLLAFVLFVLWKK